MKSIEKVEMFRTSDGILHSDYKEAETHELYIQDEFPGVNTKGTYQVNGEVLIKRILITEAIRHDWLRRHGKSFDSCYCLKCSYNK